MQPVADPRAEGRSPPPSADAARSMGKGARTFVLGRGLEAAGTGPTSPWLGGWPDQEQVSEDLARIWLSRPRADPLVVLGFAAARCLLRGAHRVLASRGRLRG